MWKTFLLLITIMICDGKTTLLVHSKECHLPTTCCWVLLKVLVTMEWIIVMYKAIMQSWQNSLMAWYWSTFHRTVKNICLVIIDNLIKLLNQGVRMTPWLNQWNIPRSTSLAERWCVGGDRSHVSSLQNPTLAEGEFCDWHRKSSMYVYFRDKQFYVMSNLYVWSHGLETLWKISSTPLIWEYQPI